MSTNTAPAPAFESPAADPAPLRPVLAPKRYLLVVDDDRDLGHALARVASLLPDVEARVASGYEEAFRTICSWVDPDCVLSDVDLGAGRDGFQVAELVQRMGLRVVLMTGDPSPERRARAQAMGVELLIKGSFDVKATLARLLEVEVPHA